MDSFTSCLNIQINQLFQKVPFIYRNWIVFKGKMQSVAWDKLTPAQQAEYNYENSLKTRAELA